MKSMYDLSNLIANEVNKHFTGKTVFVATRYNDIIPFELGKNNIHTATIVRANINFALYNGALNSLSVDKSNLYYTVTDILFNQEFIQKSDYDILKDFIKEYFLPETTVVSFAYKSGNICSAVGHGTDIYVPDENETIEKTTNKKYLDTNRYLTNHIYNFILNNIESYINQIEDHSLCGKYISRDYTNEIVDVSKEYLDNEPTLFSDSPIFGTFKFLVSVKHDVNIYPEYKYPELYHPQRFLDHYKPLNENEVK